MPDIPSHFSVSSPSLSNGLPFFATLASVKPGVNYGPIINVAGLPFSWTPSGYEPSSGTFTFPTLSSLLSTAPKPGMCATALDAPGSSLFWDGAKWVGTLGSGFPSLAAVQAVTSGNQALLALGVTAGTVNGVRVRFDTFIAGWVVVGGSARSIRGIKQVAVVGQSNEQGCLRQWTVGSLPIDTASVGLRYVDPLPGQSPSRRRGSVWPSVADILESTGIRLSAIYNGAVGSTSMIKDVCGWLYNFNTWQANSVVYQKRASAAVGDAGDKGDHLLVGTKLFRVKVGTLRYCMINDPSNPVTISGTSYKWLDYLAYGPDVKTGATTPNWASATNVGDTVMDGSVTWELVNATYSSADGSYIAAATDPYFDPLGICARVLAQTWDPAVDKILYLQNGQSDRYFEPAFWSIFVTKYAKAYQNVATYFAGLGWTVFIGNSSGIPSEAVLSNGYYPSQASQQAATKAVADAASASIKRGADWFNLFWPNPRCWPESGTADSGTRVHLTAENCAVAAEAVANAISIGLGLS